MKRISVTLTILYAITLANLVTGPLFGYMTYNTSLKISTVGTSVFMINFAYCIIKERKRRCEVTVDQMLELGKVLIDKELSSKDYFVFIDIVYYIMMNDKSYKGDDVSYLFNELNTYLSKSYARKIKEAIGRKRK